jgi:hypothetical protein
MKWRGSLGAAVLAMMVAHAATGPLVTLTADGGVLNVPDGPSIPMTTIGTGLRKKKIMFVTFSVYSARFLVATSDAPKFERTSVDALGSLDGISAAAMYLTFERSVSAQQLSDSLSAAMNVNGYSVNGNPDLLALAKTISATGSIPSGSVCVLAALRVDSVTDLVVYQAPSGTIASIRGRTGLKRALMSAWFGKPADGGLRALRDEIFGIPPRH